MEQNDMDQNQKKDTQTLSAMLEQDRDMVMAQLSWTPAEVCG